MESKNKTNKTEFTDTQNRLEAGRWEGGNMDEGGQKIQISGYKVNKSGGCNVQPGDYNY